MNKQALLTAISDCRKKIERRDIHDVQCGAFGLHIIETLMSDAECRSELEIHIVDATDLPEPLKARIDDLAKKIAAENQKPYICPRCGNEEFSPGAKFCRICGMAIMESKEGQSCNHQH